MLVVKKIKYKNDLWKIDINYVILLNNLGNCYYKFGNFKVLDCLKKGLEILFRLNVDYELVGVYGLFLLFYVDKDLKILKMYVKKGYDVVCKVNFVLFKVNVLVNLIKKFEGKELKKYFVVYIKIIDSMVIGR